MHPTPHGAPWSPHAPWSQRAFRPQPLTKRVEMIAASRSLLLEAFLLAAAFPMTSKMNLGWFTQLLLRRCKILPLQHQQVLAPQSTIDYF